MIFHQSYNSQGVYLYNYCEFTDIAVNGHVHKSLEFICVQEGDLSLTVHDRREVIHAGECALILPMQVHAFIPSPRACFQILVFSDAFVPEFAALTKSQEGETSVFACDPEPRPSSVTPCPWNLLP